MSVYISVDLQRQIRRRFSNCCAYCQTAEALIVTTFEIEHIIPRSLGGETTFENLCLSCPSCNRYKSSRQTATDPLSQEVISLFHPHLQRWLDIFNWGEDSTEIIGITPTGRATIAALKMNRPELIRIRRMWVTMGEHPPNLNI